MKIIFLIFCSFLFFSCGDLKKVEADNREVVLLESELNQDLKKIKSETKSLIVFFWPTEELFKEYRELGLVNEESYENYIAKISHEIFVKSKTLSDEAKDYDARVEFLMEKINEVEREKEEVFLRIQNLSSELRSLEREKRELKSKVEEQQVQGESADFGEMLERLDEIKSLGQTLFKEKKSIEKEELDVFSEREAIYYDEFFELNRQKAQHFQEIQMTLDPQAVLQDEYGVKIDKDLQVNWVDIGGESSEAFHTIDLEGDKIEIKFSGWDGQVYQTRYRKEKAGFVLSEESDIYDLSFSPLEKILQFKIWQRNKESGEVTGHFYSVNIERHDGKEAAYFQGEITLVHGENHKVLKKGQIMMTMDFLP